MEQVNDELAGEWTFDPAHSRIGFSARHAMVTKVRGAFNEVDGRMYVAPAGHADSSVSVRLEVASIDTRNVQRDTHLRSGDFFDAERYPDIVFTSTTIDEVEDRMYMVVGDLTIRGITREVSIPIERLGVERGADGELRAGFEGTRRLDRRQWGLEWQVPLDAGGVLVSERVTMEFEISAVKLPDAPDAPDAPDDTPGADTTEDGDATDDADTTPGADTIPGADTTEGPGTPPAGTEDDDAPPADADDDDSPSADAEDDDAAPAVGTAASPDPGAPAVERPTPAQPAPKPSTGGRHRAPTGWLARMRARRGRQ